MWRSRREKLTCLLQTNGMEALILNPGPSLVYLTGLHFHLSERPVVVIFTLDGRVAAVLPELETPKLDSLPFEMHGYAYPEDPAEWGQTFHRALHDLGLSSKSIGVEPRRLRLLEFGFLKDNAPRAEFPDASGLIASMRVCKDAGEVEALRRAVRIAQQALTQALQSFRIGMAEKELSAELTLQLLRLGSEPEMPFSPIVSGGPNAANPHAMPSGRKIQSGDLLVIDWGATVDGYMSDLTRTFAVGRVDAECMKIHRVVQEANAAGRAAARPGVACGEVDRAARALIEQAGYGSYFTHRTGHGIGLENHEDPFMRGDNPQLMETGMVFTVEPGIYLPGRNGVRIEDNVVVTQAGTDCLSDMPRELTTIS